jgi:hypothetical protein
VSREQKMAKYSNCSSRSMLASTAWMRALPTVIQSPCAGRMWDAHILCRSIFGQTRGISLQSRSLFLEAKPSQLAVIAQRNVTSKLFSNSVTFRIASSSEGGDRRSEWGLLRIAPLVPADLLWLRRPTLWKAIGTRPTGAAGCGVTVTLWGNFGASRVLPVLNLKAHQAVVRSM